MICFNPSAATLPLVALIVITLTCTPESDSNTINEKDIIDFDDMMVTAERTRKVSTVPANVTVITSEDIVRTNAQNLPEILKFVSGIEVSDRFGNGRKASVDIRGFGETAASNTLVLVDGRRITGTDLSGTDWTTIPTERIERIEIIRGGNSVIYGDNATGGVINIITKKGDEDSHIVLEFEGGDYQHYNPSADFSGQLLDGSLSYSINGSYLDTDGFRDNSFFRNKTAAVGLNYVNNSGLTIEISGGSKDDRYGLPGSISEDADRRSTTDPNNFAETDESYLRFVPLYQLDEFSQIRLATNYRQQDQFSVFIDPVSKFESNSDITEFEIAPQFNTQFNLGEVNNRFTIGFDFFQSDIDSKSIFESTTFGESTTTSENTRKSRALYLHENISLLDSTVFFDLGYRYNRIKYEFESARDVNHNIDAAKMGLTWNYSQNNKIFVAYDRSFRSQLLDEFGGSTFDQPLKPQISKHLQLGIRHLFDFQVEAEITIFQIKTKDEILFDPNFIDPNSLFPFPGQNVNYEETRRRGIELDLNYRISDTIQAFANYTVVDPKLTEGVYDGNTIPGVAENSGSFGVHMAPIKNLSVNIQARWVDDRTILGDWQNNEKWDDDFFVMDIKLSYTIGAVTLYGGISNIFNEEYSEVGGFNSFEGVEVFPAPERNFFFGLRYTANL